MEFHSTIKGLLSNFILKKKNEKNMGLEKERR